MRAGPLRLIQLQTPASGPLHLPPLLSLPAQPPQVPTGSLLMGLAARPSRCPTPTPHPSAFDFSLGTYHPAYSTVPPSGLLHLFLSRPPRQRSTRGKRSGSVFFAALVSSATRAPLNEDPFLQSRDTSVFCFSIWSSVTLFFLFPRKHRLFFESEKEKSINVSLVRAPAPLPLACCQSS